MPKYTCDRCLKEFSQKSHFDKDLIKKKPCQDNKSKIEEVVENIINKKLINENTKLHTNTQLVMDNIETDDYSDLSRKITADISKVEKKNNGIFFTPPTTISYNIKLLAPYMKDVKTILEPSCGSCEYISKLNNMNSNYNICGIELNKKIYESIKHYNSDNLILINDNYLTYKFTTKFDLIIGNPPYFVIKKTDEEECYFNYFDGRPNIFILFIIKSLELLNANGILSFILPKNFLNCLYYDKTRKYLFENYKILNIVECDDKYIETQQNTIILIIQNKKPTNDNNLSYSINISNYTIFGTKENIKLLKSLYSNSTTLNNLGFNVSVGNVVWNQCKEILTDDNEKTLLIYSSDIVNNELCIKKYSNKEKKNYIDKTGDDRPIIVINRGYGVGSYKFNYCIINENENNKIKYLIENHLICIKYSTDICNNDLIEKYRQLVTSLENDKTKKFIKLYFGNNAMNTTELCKILPIYDI